MGGGRFLCPATFRTISVLAEIDGYGRWLQMQGTAKKANNGETRKQSTGRAERFSGYEVHIVKGKIMRILITTVIAALALPLIASGPTTEEPEQTQGQTKETQTTAPAKGKKMRPAQEQSKPEAKPETGTKVRGQTNVRGRTQDVS